MKKILSIILALTTALTMAFVMASCDEEAPVSDGSIPQQDISSAAAEENESPFPEALSNFEALEIGEIDNTFWTLSGGMIDGVEMEQEDLDATLTSSGGTMQVAFLSEKKVNIVTGNGNMEGTYDIVSDGYIIDAVFPEAEYYMVFTPVEEQPVLILVNKQESETALYFTLLDEK